MPVAINSATYVNVEKLINKFVDMSQRGTLLTGRSNITQEDLLLQIIGTIVQTASESEEV